MSCCLLHSDCKFLISARVFSLKDAVFNAFFIFVLIGLGFTYKKLRVRTLFLFCVSLYFYYKTSGFFFSILLFSTIVDYFIGKGIYAAKNKRNAQLFLAASITINLVVLIYFKYAYFFVDSFNSMLGSDWHPINHFALATNTLTGSTFRVDQILLPIGISFYTFQTMSYAIDIYREKLKPVNHIIDFGFYVSFFPQLVAGPIVRASEFIPQIYRPYKVNKEMFGLALFWIINGLLKKFLLADNWLPVICETGNHLRSPKGNGEEWCNGECHWVEETCIKNR